MPNLTNEILREVGMLSRCIQSISDIKFREFKLQRGQFIFFTRICENPGINLIDLSNILKVDKATTTKAIQKLLAEDYVWRTRDSMDKRMWHLFPSLKAQKIYSYLIQEENRNIEICLQGFTQAERDLVHRLLKKMRENIELDWKALKSYNEDYD
ncbi:MarR family winged helix-turn-helix transcriptional regulator [Sporomusa termitida]|uniref:HTH marR-type domain-containing protein n=1 Tax=Sporomusa termitida TaxID=2377 RepID=A0A517DQA0_9FIRM|nr:MarR family winged helix-turn-helix transcriptional regulator [Sporomusa termitida]QDR79488.1 hypothetical protein SPTER_07630 [Sporomusa termitida]